jgi:hypothetical protein
MNKTLVTFGLVGLTLTVLYAILVVGPAIQNFMIAKQNVAIANQELADVKAELNQNMQDMGQTVDEITEANA